MQEEQVTMTNEEVKRIQRALNALANVLKVDGVLGPITRAALMDFQRSRGLPVNGVPDEKTLATLWRAVPAEMPPPAPIVAPSSDALVLAGQRALAEMVRLFELDVYDPLVSEHSDNAKRCKAIITGIIVRNGWRFALLERSPSGEYPGNGSPQWCGMTAGDAWREAGLDPKWLLHHWASTSRLLCWFNYKPFEGHSSGTRPETGARMIVHGTESQFPDGTPFREGDIVIVGDGTPVMGDHVTMLKSHDPRTGRFTTISGNGGGVGPKGDPRPPAGGISLRDYYPDRGGYRVMFVARPGVGDLIAV
jgi:hypothetical protein